MDGKPALVVTVLAPASSTHVQHACRSRWSGLVFRRLPWRPVDCNHSIFLGQEQWGAAQSRRRPISEQSAGPADRSAAGNVYSRALDRTGLELPLGGHCVRARHAEERAEREAPGACNRAHRASRTTSWWIGREAMGRSRRRNSTSHRPPLRTFVLLPPLDMLLLIPP